MSESCPKLLDLIPKNKREWVFNNGEEKGKGSCSSGSCEESKTLELRLGLPGDEGWSAKHNLKNNPFKERDESLFSLRYFSDHKQNSHQQQPAWPCSGYQAQTQQQQQQLQKQQQQQNTNSAFLHHPHSHQYQTGPNKGLGVMGKESSQPCCTRIVDLQNAEKKGAFPPASANTAVPNTSQKRAAPAPVVGWPPVRSFRKNLASTSSAKPVSEPQSAIPSKPVNEKPSGESSHKGLFVKINMDGVPIGRKVDLSAYNSYGKLSTAVDELFRGLLAAQGDSSAGGIDNKQEEQKPITGLLDRSGEYTLVYEDNEGDRMLVGDVPWDMFVSTVKRLRVLKSSDLPTLSLGGSKEGKALAEIASK